MAEKLLRCWNCNEIINVEACKDCDHATPTKVCPYCGKCLHDNPEFVKGNLGHKKIRESEGSWHIGYFLHVADCDGCEEKSYAAAEVEAEFGEKLESLLEFIQMRQESCRTSLKEYVGSDKSQAEKFMAGLYRKEIAVYDDVFSWAQFFLGIDYKPKETAVKPLEGHQA